MFTRCIWADAHPFALFTAKPLAYASMSPLGSNFTPSNISQPESSAVRSVTPIFVGGRPRTAHVAIDGSVVVAGPEPIEGDWVPGSPGGRQLVADAPLLVDRPDGFSAPFLRTLDRVRSDGIDAPGWTERLLTAD